MAHQQQINFCNSVKEQYPEFFKNRFVVDIGSFDVNGNNQYLFENCLYIGVDLLLGKNVDLASKGHELNLPDSSIDTIISTECFEHDQHYMLTLKNIVRMLKPGGAFIFTCATAGRAEHGTRKTTPEDAPFIQNLGDWADYYKNLGESDIRSVLDIDILFESYQFSVNSESHDLYFWGIKKGNLIRRLDYTFQIENSIFRNSSRPLEINLTETIEKLNVTETLLRSTEQKNSSMIALTNTLNTTLIETKEKLKITEMELRSTEREHSKIVALTKTLEGNLTETKEKLGVTETLLHSTEQKNSTMITLTNTLNTTLIETKEKLKVTEMELHSTKLEHSKIVSLTKTLEDSLIETKDTLSATETLLQFYKDQHEANEKKLFALETKMNEQSLLSKKITDNHHKLTVDIEKLALLKREKENKITELENMLDHMSHSRSWRITKPFRTIKITLVSNAIRYPLVSIAKNTSFLINYYRVRFNPSVMKIQSSPLFDTEYYLAKYPDIKGARITPAAHYYFHGWKEHRNPSADFNTKQYLNDNIDVAQSGINPLLHYIRFGYKEGRILPTQGLHSSSILNAEFPSDMEIKSVKQIGSIIKDTDIVNATVEMQATVIKDSNLFDEEFYLSMYNNSQLRHDPIIDYCSTGWKEGRNPSADFDGSYYLSVNDDIRKANINPFFHYVIAGASEGRYPKSPIEIEIDIIKKSDLFDETFYLSRYSELKLMACDAIRHYCENGWREGRNPSDEFDTNYYLATYPDIANNNINPFWHYIVNGKNEARRINSPSNHYEDDIRFGVVDSNIKMIAIYSNNEKLCYEKSNSQLFASDEGLNLDSSNDWLLLNNQIQLAKKHGLYGFCFDLTDESNKEKLNPSLKIFLDNNTLEFQFCIRLNFHDNENPDPILLQAIADKRYIHVENRPVILMTSPIEINTMKALGEAYIIYSCTPEEKYDDADDFSGLCDAVLFHSNTLNSNTNREIAINKSGCSIISYSDIVAKAVECAQNYQTSTHPIYHTITLGFDNTTNNKLQPIVCKHFTIKEYRLWLDSIICTTRVSHPEDRRFIFLNSWNNWNNGLFIEPDKKTGFLRINETTRALLGIPYNKKMPKVSIIVPNYNHEHFLRRRLNSIFNQTYQNIEVILLDDCSSDESRTLLDRYASIYSEITRTIYNDVNSGSPFRQWAKGIKEAAGDLIWIAESDDYCDKNFLEALVHSFEDEAVLLSQSKLVFVDKNERVIYNEFQIYTKDLNCGDKWNSSYIETAHNEVVSALGIKNTIPNASGVLFRRPIDMPLLEDESWLSMRVAGDWIFYLHLIRGGKVAYSTETTSYFRRYEGSTAQNTYKKEVFYRELGMAARAVSLLYRVPLTVLEENKNYCKKLYEFNISQNINDFFLWYDYESIIRTRQKRIPNILISTMGFYPGGAEIFPIRLANEFKRQGISVLLFSTGLNPHEEKIRKMLRNDIPVVETSDIKAMKSIIHDFDIEVLNTHHWHIQKYPLHVSDVFSQLSAHVATLHGMIEHVEAFSVTKDQLLQADKNVTRWVYTAEKNLIPFHQNDLIKVSERFIKIPNGIAPSKITPKQRRGMDIPEDAFVFCCVSRAIPDKGWGELIQSIELARFNTGRDIRLILVGNGPVYDEYCQVGTPSFVYLAGFCEESIEFYSAADCGIMLTKFKSESFPLTILDCLLAGKPYIASDVGDIRNMLTVENSIAGELIELNNWEIPIEIVANTLADFVLNENKYLNALKVVKKAADRYKIDKVASQYISLFTEHKDAAIEMD